MPCIVNTERTYLYSTCQGLGGGKRDLIELPICDRCVSSFLEYRVYPKPIQAFPHFLTWMVCVAHSCYLSHSIYCVYHVLGRMFTRTSSTIQSDSIMKQRYFIGRCAQPHGGVKVLQYSLGSVRNTYTNAHRINIIIMLQVYPSAVMSCN